MVRVAYAIRRVQVVQGHLQALPETPPAKGGEVKRKKIGSLVSVFGGAVFSTVHVVAGGTFYRGVSAYRLHEAKRLHSQLGRAIAYVESERTPKAGRGRK